MLDGDEVVYIHKLDSPEPVRAYSQVGGRAPAYRVATGKSMLAFQRPAFLVAISARLQSHSPRTITQPAEFLREMESVRRQGYAVNRGSRPPRVSGPRSRARGRPAARLAEALQAFVNTGGVNTCTGGGVPVNFSISTRQVWAVHPCDRLEAPTSRVDAQSSPPGIVFHPARAIDETAVAQVQTDLRRRILRAFVGRGLIEKADAKEGPALVPPPRTHRHR